MPSEQAREVSTLAGGCFWCLEAVFEQVRGVEHVVSGYVGGHVENPTYEQVCTTTTGHAEAVQVTFDPSVITFREILGLFFAMHDPTTLNRQGHDVGPQYRSVVFWHSNDQRETTAQVITELGNRAVWSDDIVTEVVPLPAFYPAEEYHQQYFRKNPDLGYCQAIIAPKVAKLRKEHMAALRI